MIFIKLETCSMRVLYTMSDDDHHQFDKYLVDSIAGLFVGGANYN